MALSGDAATKPTASSDDAFFAQATLVGGAGGESLRGSADPDRLEGLGGDDTLFGLGGADRLLGGQGDDDLRGGGGGDVLKGASGDDALRGGGGDDTLRGGGGDDSLIGGAGADRLVGGAGSDTLNGGGRGDFILAGGRADVLNGGKGGDTLKGGGGADVVNGGIGADSLEGGADGDLFIFRRKDFSAGETDVVADFELGVDQIDLRPFADAPGFTDLVFSLEGGALALLLHRGRVEFEGIDDPTAFDADDFLLSDEGGGASGGTIVINADGEREIRGLTGQDALIGGDGNEALFGGGARDRLAGGGGDDALIGGGGADTLIGGAGSDTLTGGGGADVFSVLAADLRAGDVDVIEDLGADDVLDLSGFARDDIAARQDGADVVATLTVGANSAELRLRDTTLAAFEERLTSLFGPAPTSPNQTGGAGADLLAGDERSNRLDGRAGADVVDGAGGDDTIIGGSGSDALSGGAGGDVFLFSKSDLADGDLDHVLDFDLSEGDRLAFEGFGDGDVSFALSTLGTGVETEMTLDGGAARVFIEGGDAATLAALQSGRVITGSDAADLLVGDQRDDTIRAGLGDDVVGTSQGADELWGEGGDDIFVLSGLPQPGDPIDKIMDFSPGDRIGLRDALAGLTFDQVGDLVTIRRSTDDPSDAVIHMRASTAEDFAPALVIADYGELLDEASPEAIARELLAISDAVSAQSGSSGGSVYGFNNLDGTAFVSIPDVLVSFDYRYVYLHEVVTFGDSFTGDYDEVGTILDLAGDAAFDLEDAAEEAFVDTRTETAYVYDAFTGEVILRDQFFTEASVTFTFDFTRGVDSNVEIDGLSDLTFSSTSSTGEYDEQFFRDFLAGVGEPQGLANGLTERAPESARDFDFDAAMDRVEEVPDVYMLVAEQGARSILLTDDFKLIGVDLSTETVVIQDLVDEFGFNSGGEGEDPADVSTELVRAIVSPDLGFAGLSFAGEFGSEFIAARLFDGPGIDDVADSRENALAIGAGVDQIIFSGDEVRRSSAGTRPDEDWFVLPATPGGEGFVVEARGGGDYVVEVYLGDDETPIAAGDAFGNTLEVALRFYVPSDHEGPVYAVVKGFDGLDVGAYDLVFTPPTAPTGGFDTQAVLPDGSRTTEALGAGETDFYRIGSRLDPDGGFSGDGVARVRPLTEQEFETVGVPAAAADPLDGAVLIHYDDEGAEIARSDSGELADVFSGFVEVRAGDDPTGAYVFEYL